MDLLHRRRLEIAADIADEDPPRHRIDAGAVGVPQPVGPDLVLVRSRPVVEGIVRRDRAVPVDPQHLAPRVGEELGVGRSQLVARGQVDLAVVAEQHPAAMVGVRRVHRVLPDHGFRCQEVVFPLAVNREILFRFGVRLV